MEMFNMSCFKDDNTGVHRYIWCNNEDESDAVLNFIECADASVHWVEGGKPTSKNYYTDGHMIGYCVRGSSLTYHTTGTHKIGLYDTFFNCFEWPEQFRVTDFNFSDEEFKQLFC